MGPNCLITCRAALALHASQPLAETWSCGTPNPVRDESHTKIPARILLAFAASSFNALNFSHLSHQISAWRDPLVKCADSACSEVKRLPSILIALHNSTASYQKGRESTGSVDAPFGSRIKNEFGRREVRDVALCGLSEDSILDSPLRDFLPSSLLFEKLCQQILEEHLGNALS
jgi:hypothetical protein